MKNFLFILVFTIASCLLPLASFSQWQQANGPYGAWVCCFAIKGDNIFVGTEGGVFLSTNKGSSWAAVNTGLTVTGVNGFGLAISGDSIYAATYSGVFLSSK